MAFIPISDDPSDRRSFPFVNYALILANIAVFVYELVKGPAFTDCLTRAYALLPDDIVHDTMHATGCSISEPAPVYITLFTAMFLHAGLLHVGGNMIYLWAFGDNVEDRLGHFWYLIFYLMCGLVASAAQIAFSEYAGQGNVLNLGASGAIAGVLGAYLVFFPGSKVRTIVFVGIFITLARLSAFIVIGFFILLQLLDAYIEIMNIGNGQVSSGGGVAFFAHIGGFFFGLIIALLVRLAGGGRMPARSSYPYWPTPPALRGR
jgi:membrane associated rhomboid family serine protease